MKLAFLDFDDVLFKTGEFSKAVRSLFLAQGVSPEDYDAFYQEMREELMRQNKVYHQKNHIKLFLQKFPQANPIFLVKNLLDLRQDMPRFVYEDTHSFLESLGHNGWYRVILTFGDKNWQRIKIYSSGLGALVEQITVTPDASKVSGVREVLKKMKKAKDIIFVDDNPYRALNAVKEKLPRVKTIQLIRPELESTHLRHEGCDHNCRSLDEVREMLLS